MIFNDTLPKEIEIEITSRLSSQEKILYCVGSDLTNDRNFGESFLVVTSLRIFIIDNNKIALDLPIETIEEIKVDELFGGARLLAQIKGNGLVALIYYTKDHIPKFGIFCRVLNQLVRGESPKFPDTDERSRCKKCHRPLPERGATCPLCVPRWQILVKLLGLIKPFKVRASILIAAVTLTVATQMVPPYLTKGIVDDVIKGGKHEQLTMYIVAMFAAGLIYLVTRIIATISSTWLAAQLVSNLRMRLHDKIQKLNLHYFQKRGPGELVGRIMHDTGELQQFLIEGLPYLMVNSISFIAIAIVLVKLDWKLSLLVFLPVPVLIFGSRWFWIKLGPLFQKRGSKVAAMHSVLNESIGGIRIVKSFVQENRRSGEFNKLNDDLFHIRYKLEGTFAGFQEIMFWTMQLGVTGVWYFASQRIIGLDPNLTLGTLLAFVGYIWLLYGPLQWFTAVLNWMTHAFSGAERIFSVLEMPTEMYESPKAVPINRAKGAIAFRDVRFSYERGKEIIKGMSFTINPGEMVGLVGKSGAGKSTIINLLCRFYDPDTGEILLDGHKLDNIKLQDLRRNLGVVQQDTFLFNGSIFENIRYGKPNASFEEVARAAKAAYAHDFILDKEEGYDTLIGEHGIQLSGGERQRISIARAILHDPPLLILDEATSSVDSETEKHIQEAIARLIKGRTTIAIAHRLATLRNANRLFVIDDGQIAEMGTHDELMERDGKYAELVKIQTELTKIRSEIWTAL